MHPSIPTDPSPRQAVLTILFGSVGLFVIGASRFKYRQYNIFFLIMSMTLGVGLGGAYHMPCWWVWCLC